MKLNQSTLPVILMALVPFVSAGGYQKGPKVVVNKGNVDSFISGLEGLMGDIPESAKGNAQ